MLLLRIHWSSLLGQSMYRSVTWHSTYIHTPSYHSLCDETGCWWKQLITSVNLSGNDARSHIDSKQCAVSTCWTLTDLTKSPVPFTPSHSLLSVLLLNEWLIYLPVFLNFCIYVVACSCLYTDMHFFRLYHCIRHQSQKYQLYDRNSQICCPPKNCPRMYSELQFCTFLSFHQWPLLILSWQNFICWWKHLVSVYIWAEQIQKYQFLLKQKTASESTLKYSSVHVSLLKNDPCWSSTNRTSSTDGNILYWKS